MATKNIFETLKFWQKKPQIYEKTTFGRKERKLSIFEELSPDTKNEGKGLVSFDPYKNQLFKGEPKDVLAWKKYRVAYNNIPIVTAAIDITADQAIQNFFVDGGDPEAREELERVIKENNLVDFFHNVAKQMLIYGNAFVEVIKGPEGIEGLKMLDPVTMYVNRDKYGKFEEAAYIQFNDYNPFKGIEFQFEEIIHFKWNAIGNSAYGTSLLHPLLHILEVKLGVEDNLDVIISRYAAPMIHVKVGSDERPANQEDIDAYSADLEDIQADTEFVTSHTVDMNVLDSGRRAMDLTAPLTYIEHQVVAGLQIPLSLLGRGEGTNRATAEVQLSSFDRRIRILQRIIKRKVELELFKVHLEALYDREFEGQDIPELMWGDPEEKQTQAEFDVVINLVQAGIITKQKANDLLPPKFRENLPEMPFVPFGKPTQMSAPVPSVDRVQSGKEKRDPKVPEREE